VIRIAITPAAYEAIERMLALGTVAAEPQVSEKGERLISLEPRWVDRLNSIRGSGQSYSVDALAAGELRHEVARFRCYTLI
jgi:hypothetical protein